jgi:hypothetical protein
MNNNSDARRYTETANLCSGIFWVLTDNGEMENYKLLAFTIPCDARGIVTGRHTIPLNSKSGTTYNHKIMWESRVRNNPAYKPYNKKGYDYYPRGRVEVANNKAVIYLNPHINKPEIVDEIKDKFGLSEQNIGSVRVVADNSAHYGCFINKG